MYTATPAHATMVVPNRKTCLRVFFVSVLQWACHACCPSITKIKNRRNVPTLPSFVLFFFTFVSHKASAHESVCVCFAQWQPGLVSRQWSCTGPCPSCRTTFCQWPLYPPPS